MAGIGVSAKFSLAAVLGEPVAIREWKLQGLPSDSFSVDNAIIMMRSSRYPLLIDPQDQAGQWLRRAEAEMAVGPPEEPSDGSGQKASTTPV